MIDVTAIKNALNGRGVAVFGLGVSGLATVSALRAAGIPTTAWDDDAAKRQKAAALGADIADLTTVDWAGYSALVVAPGIALTFPTPHPIPARAHGAGVEVLGDVELLHRAGHDRKTIGITGTNGKSTTTALVGHVLNASSVSAAVGGNIGRAVLDMDVPPENGVMVLELSSYQLDSCPTFAPDIGVHLNLTPDHLDRHGDMAGYAAAKMRIFRGNGAAIIGVDDAPSRAMLADVKAGGMRDCYEISVVGPVSRGAYVVDGILYDRMNDGDARVVGSVAGLNILPGVHNHQNIAAAYIVARLCGVAADDILAAVKTYPGLPHRQYLTRTINGILYINDSKATNADATEKALVCYDDIYWIVGGTPKDGGLNGLDPYMNRVRQAFLIGKAADEFSIWLAERGVETVMCGTLENAVTAAHRAAQESQNKGGVVLLSPACASFDQFLSFEHRGNEFARFVAALPNDGGE